MLEQERRFVPKYDQGRTEFPGGEVVSRGFNLLVHLEEAFRRGGEAGQWSLAHHSYHGDLFVAAKELLGELSAQFPVREDLRRPAAWPASCGYRGWI